MNDKQNGEKESLKENDKDYEAICGSLVDKLPPASSVQLFYKKSVK